MTLALESTATEATATRRQAAEAPDPRRRRGGRARAPVPAPCRAPGPRGRQPGPGAREPRRPFLGRDVRPRPERQELRPLTRRPLRPVRLAAHPRRPDRRAALDGLGQPRGPDQGPRRRDAPAPSSPGSSAARPPRPSSPRRWACPAAPSARSSTTRTAPRSSACRPCRPTRPTRCCPARTRAPRHLLLRREELGYLRDAVAELPERLRTVVERYFFQQHKMADIARDLGVTESRISQLRSVALTMLREGMHAADPAERPVRSVASARSAATTEAYRAAVVSRSTLAGRLAATTVLGESRTAAHPAHRQLLSRPPSELPRRSPAGSRTAPGRLPDGSRAELSSRPRRPPER